MAIQSIVKVSELEGAMRFDAEYYQPKYVDAVEAVKKYPSVKSLSEMARVLRGRNPSKYTDSGIPVIRAVDLRDITDLSNVLYANPTERLFYLKEGDILISSIGAGSIGKVELFTTNHAQKTATVSEVSVVRVLRNTYNAAALLVFLRSRYGYLQIERRITGSTGQLHLYPKDINTILIPMLDKHVQDDLAAVVGTSMNMLRKSKSLYLQAEQMLLDELEWNQLDLSQPKYYTVPLSRATEIHRVDAEHFQPKYDKLIAHLKNTGNVKLLGEIALYIKRGLQPIYVEKGEVVVVTSQQLSRYLLSVEATERTSEQFWQGNKRCRLQKYDVLLYSTGAYVGRTNPWMDGQKGIASNHVTIIRPDQSCDPLYLSVFLNSRLGILQADRWASGSGQREIYPENIAQFLVYLPPKKFQAQVADLVTQSYQARQKARSLLDKAKHEVETLIEERR